MINKQRSDDRIKIFRRGFWGMEVFVEVMFMFLVLGFALAIGLAWGFEGSWQGQLAVGKG